MAVVMMVPLSVLLLAFALIGEWIALRRILMVGPNGQQIAYLIFFAAASVFLLVFFAAALAIGMVPAAS